jgi:hypothetical protein
MDNVKRYRKFNNICSKNKTIEHAIIWAKKEGDPKWQYILGSFMEEPQFHEICAGTLTTVEIYESVLTYYILSAEQGYKKAETARERLQDEHSSLERNDENLDLTDDDEQSGSKVVDQLLNSLGIEDRVGSVTYLYKSKLIEQLSDATPEQRNKYIKDLYYVRRDKFQMQLFKEATERYMKEIEIKIKVFNIVIAVRAHKEQMASESAKMALVMVQPPVIRCDVCEDVCDPSYCAKCEVAKYCSKACQKTAWKTHKTVCVKI